jgi:spore coat protein U-like protein
MKRFLSSVLPVFALLAFAAPAAAQSIAPHAVNVSANVAAACTLQSAGGDILLTASLADLGAMAPSLPGALVVRCTRGVQIQVAAGSADAGLARLAACTTAATCGTESLAFSLYVSSTGTDVPRAATLLSNTNLSLGRSLNRGTNISVSYEARFDPAADPLAGDYFGSVPVTYTVAP